MFSINQLSDSEWEVLGADGARLGDTHGTYAEALAFIGGMLAVGRDATAELADGDDDTDAEGTGSGLLPETWEDVEGICFSEPTPDGRDFTGCTWTSRDPAVSLLPLMLQTSTDYGHFGAVLAGFITELSDLGAGTTPRARGNFYDSDAGRQFRDMLLEDRPFGVSVDPGRVSVEWVCTEEDDDGYCIAEAAQFTDYEVIGLTGTPFPAFARARIHLSAATASAAADVPPAVTVAAAASVRSGVSLDRPPRDWLFTPEPELGEPFALGSLGDEWLVDQGQGRVAMPLHITEDGRLAGHLAVDGQCHVGYQGVCVSPPQSATGYAQFHLGETVCADGTRVPVGTLATGCDHAVAQLRAPEARDHYAHNGLAWASVRVVDGRYGPWVAGVLHSNVTEGQLAVLRAGALSGDWRRIGGHLELIAALAVTTPGFPIAREAITASGLGITPVGRMRAATEGGVPQSLVASGVVRRCPDCQRRQAALGTPPRTQEPATIGATEAMHLLRTLERRTRHLVPDAAQFAASRLGAR